MKKTLFLTSSLLIVTFCSGCMSTAPYKYIPSEKIRAQTEPLPLVASIMALEDLRDNDNADYTLVGWIPFMPYGTAHFSRPEAAFKFSFKRFNPREDFASAIYEEIKQSGLFQAVRLVPQNSLPNAGLVISGSIKKASVDSTVTFYGMSFLGELPWFLGLPMGKVYNTLDVHYEMRKASDNSLVWEHDVKGDWSSIVGAYYNSYEDEPYTGINKILQEGLHQGMLKLAEDIQNNPPSYWK